MRFACWINKATNVPSEFVILVLRWKTLSLESASVLRCTYIACLLYLLPHSKRNYAEDYGVRNAVQFGRWYRLSVKLVT